MAWRHLLGFLLLAFLGVRAADSAWVVATDRHRLSRLDRLWEPTAARARHTLIAEDERGIDDRFLRQYELLLAHTTLDDRTYYLHEFTGSYTVIQQFERIRWAMYPRYLQPIRRLPLPASPRTGVRDGAVLVLDCRRQPTDLPSDFERIAATEGAVLWRARRGN